VAHRQLYPATAVGRGAGLGARCGRRRQRLRAARV